MISPAAAVAAAPPAGPRPAGRRRGGFTVIELLVVCGVVGLLAALILPAVMASRAAARRTACVNNLRQFGIALHDRHAVRGTFPPAATDEASPPWPFSSPHVALLPHLGERARTGRAADDPGGRGDIPTFRCPADPAGAGTNYRACVGAGLFALPAGTGAGPLGTPAEAGAFALWDGLPAAAVRDGLSQTAAFSEARVSGPSAAWDPRTDYWYTAAALSGRYPTPGELAAVCGGFDGVPPTHYPDAGRSWARGDFTGTLYNHAAGPNPTFPGCSAFHLPGGYVPEGGLHPATSDHPGGVNVVLLDGAVRFVGDAVDLALWRAAATRDGGEAVSF